MRLQRGPQAKVGSGGGERGICQRTSKRDGRGARRQGVFVAVAAPEARQACGVVRFVSHRDVLEQRGKCSKYVAVASSHVGIQRDAAHGRDVDDEAVEPLHALSAKPKRREELCESNSRRGVLGGTRLVESVAHVPRERLREARDFVRLQLERRSVIRVHGVSSLRAHRGSKQLAEPRDVPRRRREVPRRQRVR